MAKVFLVVGLPGSGKTHYAKGLAASRGAPLYDDVSKHHPDIKCLIPQFLEHQVCVITDPQLCVPGAQEYAKKIFSEANIEVEWICFENNPEACLRNADKRERNVAVDIRVLTSLYQIPFGASVLPVWQDVDERPL